MASKKTKKIVDNYPRGTITLNDGSSAKIEQIEQLAGGVIFKYLRQIRTTFIPYQGFKNILYDNVPQEIIDARISASKDDQSSS